VKLASTLIFVTFGTFAAAARAQVTEIYKCTDPGGRPLYTSEKRDTSGKKCELVSREVNAVPQPVPKAPRSASPGSFPKESAAERASAKGRQREILQQELATEQKLLAQAKQKLAEQEAVRGGNENNYARVLERLQPYKDTVEVHEKNVEALRRELSNAR
jgi:uncharacterized protein DUF4124